MINKSGRLWFVAIVSIACLGGGVASAQLLGPLPEPPGGVTVTPSNDDFAIGFAAGLSLEYTGFDPTAYSALYWGPLPGEVKLATKGDEGGDPADPFEGLEIMVFDLGSSNLGSGVAAWSGETSTKWFTGSSWSVSLVPSNLVLSTGDLAGTPLPMIEATIVGLSDGAVLGVEGDFRAKLLMEFGSIHPAIEYFDGDSTDPDDTLYNTIYTSFDSGFWYTGEADVAVSTTADPAVAGVGLTVVFTVTVTNIGPQSATALVVNDLVPAETSYQSDDGGGFYDSGTGDWTIDKIASGGQAVLNITTLVTSGTVGTTIFNIAELMSVQQSDPNSIPGNGEPGEDDQDSIGIELYYLADASVSLDDGQVTAIPGEDITYILQVRNDSGPDPIAGATVTDIFPAALNDVGWTCLAGGSATCTLIGSGDISDTVDLPVGGSVTYTIDATIDHLATGDLVNSGSVALGALYHDGNAANDTATDTDTLLELDYGDAPDIGPAYFPTVFWDGGARHVVTDGVFLGATVDGETDGQPNETSTGDDADGNDDEDGVIFDPPKLIPGTSANLTVTASTVGYLNAWVDFDGDGSWTEPDERIFTDEQLLGGAAQLSFLVPAGEELQAYYTRFRFTSYLTSGQLGPIGLADDGEVEDHFVCELIFSDGFESGTTSAWSVTSN